MFDVLQLDFSAVLWETVNPNQNNKNNNKHIKAVKVPMIEFIDMRGGKEK